LQKNFQVLMTVNCRDTATSVILIYMTRKMMHCYLMMQMTTWLTTMLCERTRATTSEKNKFFTGISGFQSRKGVTVDKFKKFLIRMLHMKF